MITVIEIVMHSVMRCFSKILHVAHCMKAEMKDSYSQNKATRSLRERKKTKKKTEEKKRQRNGMIKTGFHA